MPTLKNKNFFVGDFFDTTGKINNLGDFDCIVGNPPWFNATGDEKLFEKYCKKLRISPQWDVKMEFVEDPDWRKTGKPKKIQRSST